jgi:hypothetical protein
MHLVEISPPKIMTADDSNLRALRRCVRFEGVTAFTRAPAEGVTREHGKTVHDNIIIFEVMVESLDRDWWACLRKNLENEFVQDEILIRAASVEKL